MCDCKEIEEIIEYTGNVAIIQRWAQELLGYHFTVIHWKGGIIMDVSALNRQFSPSYDLHLIIYVILSQVDRINIPQAYSHEYFKENAPVCIKPASESELLPIPVLSLSVICAYTSTTVTNLTPFSTP